MDMSLPLNHAAERLMSGARGFMSHDGPERAIFTRSAAEAIVDARVQFTDKDGAPDYAGSSGDYRQWVGDALSPLDASTRERFLRAVRWHVSRVLRERFPERYEGTGSFQDRARVTRTQKAEDAALLVGDVEVERLPQVHRLAVLAGRAFDRVLVPPDRAGGRQARDAAAALRSAGEKAIEAAERVSPSE